MRKHCVLSLGSGFVRQRMLQQIHFYRFSVFQLFYRKVLNAPQIESLEMRVEVALEQKTMGNVKSGGIYAEAKAWSNLFSKRYRKRTMIGVLMMFFQRMYRFPYTS